MHHARPSRSARLILIVPYFIALDVPRTSAEKSYAGTKWYPLVHGAARQDSATLRSKRTSYRRQRRAVLNSQLPGTVHSPSLLNVRIRYSA